MARRRLTKRELATSRSRLRAVGEAQALAQSVAQEAQESAHSRIAGLVSRCLESIYGDEYGFRIVFEKKRGRTEARPVFLEEGHEIDPRQASAGGMLDVAAFGLRLASLMLAKPAKRKLLILDEPFKFLSAEYRDNAAQMLLTLAEELGVQFVMVTHLQALELGTVVRLAKKPAKAKSQSGPAD